MNTTTATTTHTREVTDRAQATIDGFRAFTDHLDTHPALADHVARYTTNRILIYTPDPDEYRTLVAALGGTRDKKPNDDYMVITRSFGPAVEVQVFTDRDAVCTRRQVGVEIVEIPDPNIDIPTVTVEQPVYEWDCNPITATPEPAPVTRDDVVDMLSGRTARVA